MLHASLIQALVAAKAGDGDLSWQIAESLGWAKFWSSQTLYVVPGEYAERVHEGLDQDWMDWPHEAFADMPAYTTDLDAALTLVPPKCITRIFVDYAHEDAEHVAEILWEEVPSFWNITTGECEGATPALAICIAALHARSFNRD